MQYRLQCCAIYYYKSLSPARVATYSVKRTCVSGWFVLPVGLYKWRITTAHPILTIRRVATCKSGKPGLDSFSETLALFSSNVLHFEIFKYRTDKMVPRNHSAGLVFFMPRIQFCSYRGGGAVQKVGGGGGGRRLGVGMNGGVGVFDKEYQSAPVNCKADRLSAKSRQNICHSHKTRQNNVACHERRQWAFSDFTSDHI